ncbi:hypothetical protein [Breznakiella homolactica]|uniref:PEGA domain-containing protein n=1 Tax=Breznakiella homolactica TaxID=2798577 RepID=A0A7T8BBV5_9SPIR|nr:hypothetical protein [Breznakiella homolactica]QQO10967.1 hypothetical protein JFL75_08630 [Breznakiella homolactica]
MRRRICVLAVLCILAAPLFSEDIRTMVAGILEVSLDNPAGNSISLTYVDSAVIVLGSDTRFFRGIELELTAPQKFLQHRGSLAIVLYSDLDAVPGTGVADLNLRQLSFEPIPNKIQTIYQIPIRTGHGLRASPYASLPAGIVRPEAFPILFRIMPVMKGLSEDIETMRFQLTARPILSDEGAVKITARFPEQLPDRPFTLLIDDEVVENYRDERVLKEGEHHLVIFSDDYRNESRRFLVERGKILELTIDLQDPTPLVVFEVPENTQIFFNDLPVEDSRMPIPTEPGEHKVRFQVGDYSVIKPLVIQKGKTYRVALTIDVSVHESD